MYDIQMVSSVLASFSVIFGVVAWFYQMRENRRINQARLFMEVYNRYNEREITEAIEDIHHNWSWVDYDDFWSKYGPESNIEKYTSMQIVSRFFDGVGVLVDKGLVDIDLVNRLMGGTVIRNFEVTEDLRDRSREKLDRPHLYENWEILYSKIKTYREKGVHIT